MSSKRRPKNPQSYLDHVKKAKASRPCGRLVGTSGPAHYLCCSVCPKPRPSTTPKPCLFTKGDSSPIVSKGQKKPSLFKASRPPTRD